MSSYWTDWGGSEMNLYSGSIDTTMASEFNEKISNDTSISYISNLNGARTPSKKGFIEASMSKKIGLNEARHKKLSKETSNILKRSSETRIFKKINDKGANLSGLSNESSISGGSRGRGVINNYCIETLTSEASDKVGLEENVVDSGVVEEHVVRPLWSGPVCHEGTDAAQDDDDDDDGAAVGDSEDGWKTEVGIGKKGGRLAKRTMGDGAVSQAQRSLSTHKMKEIREQKTREKQDKSPLFEDKKGEMGKEPHKLILDPNAQHSGLNQAINRYQQKNDEKKKRIETLLAQYVPELPKVDENYFKDTIKYENSIKDINKPKVAQLRLPPLCGQTTCNCKEDQVLASKVRLKVVKKIATMRKKHIRVRVRIHLVT